MQLRLVDVDLALKCAIYLTGDISFCPSNYLSCKISNVIFYTLEDENYKFLQMVGKKSRFLICIKEVDLGHNSFWQKLLRTYAKHVYHMNFYFEILCFVFIRTNTHKISECFIS